jgi:hypothetical protein
MTLLVCSRLAATRRVLAQHMEAELRDAQRRAKEAEANAVRARLRRLLVRVTKWEALVTGDVDAYNVHIWPPRAPTALQVLMLSRMCLQVIRLCANQVRQIGWGSSTHIAPDKSGRTGDRPGKYVVRLTWEPPPGYINDVAPLAPAPAPASSLPPGSSQLQPYKSPTDGSRTPTRQQQLQHQQPLQLQPPPPLHLTSSHEPEAVLRQRHHHHHLQHQHQLQQHTAPDGSAESRELAAYRLQKARIEDSSGAGGGPPLASKLSYVVALQVGVTV